MGDYRDVTSNLEGRLLLLKGKVKDGAQPKPSDLFLSRGPQSFHVSLRTAGVKPFEDLQDSSYNSATSFNTSEELLTDHNSVQAGAVRQCGTFEATQTKCLEASIVLAEPALYVQSYDKVHAEAHTSAVLRGIVQLRVPEVGIARPISLELCGFSSTQWPESWRLRNVGKTDQHKFFSKKMRLCNPISERNVKSALYAIEFELPVSSVLPETIDLPMGRVHYELVVACGDVQLCRRTIRVVRMNCMCSLESAEPWVVTGQQDFIRFFFLFHGSSFRIGGPVPITVRLSHYSEVTWHQLEIRLVEDIEYSTHNGRALRILSRDRGALLRRQIGGAIRTASQVEVESIASAAKNVPMANLNVYPPTIKSLTANSLDVGTMNLTETVVMDGKVELRLPPCGDNKSFPKSRRIHHGTAYRPMHVQHYLKVIILVSRPLKAPNQEMTYELVLRIPIHIISCKVRETDTLLPAYRSGPDVPDNIEKFVCTCDAHHAGVPSSTETAIFSQYLAEGGRDLCDTSPPRYTG